MQSLERERREQNIYEGINNPSLLEYLKRVERALPHFSGTVESGDQWKISPGRLAREFSGYVPALGWWNNVNSIMGWVKKKTISEPIIEYLGKNKNRRYFFDFNRTMAFSALFWRFEEKLKSIGKDFVFRKDVPEDLVAEVIQETKLDLKDSFLNSYINELQETSETWQKWAERQENSRPEEIKITTHSGPQPLVKKFSNNHEVPENVTGNSNNGKTGEITISKQEKGPKPVEIITIAGLEFDKKELKYLSELPAYGIEATALRFPNTNNTIPLELDRMVMACLGLFNLVKYNIPFDKNLIEDHEKADYERGVEVVVFNMREKDMNVVQLLQALVGKAESLYGQDFFLTKPKTAV